MEKVKKAKTSKVEQISVSVVLGTKEKLEKLAEKLELSNSKFIELVVNGINEDELKKIYLNFLQNKINLIQQEKNENTLEKNEKIAISN